MYTVIWYYIYTKLRVLKLIRISVELYTSTYEIVNAVNTFE